MTNIESLRLITEAVETAGADIAPSYAEYVQLAQQTAAKQDVSFFTACAGYPPNISASMPNECSPTPS